MSDKTYRAAVIGLGMIGGADQVSGDALGQKVSGMDGTHTHAYQNHPRIDLVAGSSRDPGRRERYETRTGAKTYADWQDMIAQESLDIVSVATYTPFHAEITIACAEAGIPVIYCEKPAATTVPDAEHMLEACQSRDALLVFNHQRRFRQDYRNLREHLLAGNLGELTSISLQWPTGRLSNVGSHVMDALFMLTGRRVQAVSATLDLTGRPDCRGAEFRDPGCWGVMRLDNDLMVTVNAPDNAQSPFRTEINGSKGRAIAGSSTITLETWDGQTETWSPADKIPSSMDRAADEIVAWLDNRTPFPCDPEEAVHTLETIVAFHASHARNAAWTDLPLSGTDREIVVLSG